jgi:TonB family protein
LGQNDPREAVPVYVPEYPSAAFNQRLSGYATLQCQVNVRGRLQACEVVAETPAGAGFASIALRMARTFRMDPATSEGKPIAAAVRVPVIFQIAEDARRPLPVATHDAIMADARSAAWAAGGTPVVEAVVVTGSDG